MKKLAEYIKHDKHIQDIARLREQKDLFLVGGTLRDILLDKHPQDYDFSVDGSGIEFAKYVARRTKGVFVVLDEHLDEARVVRDEIIYDFIGLNQAGVVPDLLRRDFTVNAMAMDVATLQFFDPCNGIKDLKKKIVRPTSAEALIADPLRILRGFRFALQLDFSLHRDFEKFARNILLKDVAAERIGDELIRIMSTRRSFNTIMRMNGLGVFRQIFPEAQKLIEDFELWDHSLNTYGTVEQLTEGGFFRRLDPEYGYYFAQPNRLALCKLAGLFHDVAKPDTLLIKEGEVHFYGHDSIGAKMIEKIAQRRLRLSRNDTDVLKKLVKEHMRLHLLATNPDLTDRAIRRFFRNLGVDWFGAMMIAWADGYATGGRTAHLERAFLRMIDLYREDMAKPKVERLVNGYDLIAMGMKPGPHFKVILQEMLDLQLEGKVNEKSDALQEVKRIAERIGAL